MAPSCCQLLKADAGEAAKRQRHDDSGEQHHGNGRDRRPKAHRPHVDSFPRTGDRAFTRDAGHTP